MLGFISRREFLRQSSVLSAAAMMPGFLKAFDGKEGEKILLVVQLTGGNDALNTVIPIRNDIYYSLRPRIGITMDKALRMNDEAALHPSMEGLKSLYDDGYLAIINSVGYPDHDLSHFRSMDIWHTASAGSEYRSEGWIGKYLDQMSGCKPFSAIEFDDTLSLALRGVKNKGLAMSHPGRFYKSVAKGYYSDIAKHHAEHVPSNMSYLYRTLAETTESAEYIYQTSRINPSTSNYPQGKFGEGLKIISGLIASGCRTRCYYISLGGFDTHVQQPLRHAAALKEFSDGMFSFVQDMKKNQCMDRVLVMAFSEFGRRVKQNAGAGTDHGKAGSMFIIGKNLKQQGMVNGMPDLVHLDKGDVACTVDFRNVYATVLQKWMKADASSVLGIEPKMMNFV